MKPSSTLLVTVTASATILLSGCLESVYPTAEVPTLQSSERVDISFDRADSNWEPDEPVPDATASPMDIPVTNDAVVPTDIDAEPTDVADTSETLDSEAPEIAPDGTDTVDTQDILVADTTQDVGEDASELPQDGFETNVGINDGGSDADSDIDPGPCMTCPGMEAPTYALYDFQPKSPHFEKTYGLDAFVGKVTVMALLASW